MTTTIVPAARGRAKSTTRQTLLRLLVGLLIMTLIVFGTTLLAFTKVYGTADTVHARTAPAIVQLSIARDALVRADNAAISNFSGCDLASFSTDSSCAGFTSSRPDTGIGLSHLAGPGEEFQNQIAIASQSLSQVAADNMAGEVGSRTLQLVEGLLVTYTSLIEHAFRPADSETMPADSETMDVLDLWSASRFLRKKGGILALVDTLLDVQRNALQDQLSIGSATVRAALVVLVPIIGGLFALLVVAQIIMRRRFRRRANVWLVLATVLLMALSAVSSVILVSQHNLEVSQAKLGQLVTAGRTQTSATSTEGQGILRKLVGNSCNTAGCPEAERLVPEVQKLEDVGDGVNDRRLTDASRDVGEQTTMAVANADLEPLIYILAILLAAVVFLGFRPRLYEYRYRSR